MSGLRVGACQTPEILGDVGSALECVETFAAQGDAQGVELLLFPECFLQGYLVEEHHLRAHALGLTDPRFAQILKRLKPINQTLVFGVIEAAGGGLIVARVPLMETGMAVADIT